MVWNHTSERIVRRQKIRQELGLALPYKFNETAEEQQVDDKRNSQSGVDTEPEGY